MSQHGWGIWYRCMGILLALLKKHQAMRPLTHARCDSVDLTVIRHPLHLFCEIRVLLLLPAVLRDKTSYWFAQYNLGVWHQ